MAVATLPYNPITGGGAFAYDAGVLSHELNGTRVALGLTRGGLEFTPGMESRQPEYDGKRVNIAGLDRMLGSGDGSEFSGTLLTITDDLLPLLTMGGAAVGGVFTPPLANTPILPESLIKLPRLELMRSDGTGIYIEFDYGFVAQWPISTTDKEEAEMEITIRARVDGSDPAFNGNVADYRIGPLTPAV